MINSHITYFQVSRDQSSFLPKYHPVNHDFLAINVKVMHLVGLWNHHWQQKDSWRYFLYTGYAWFLILIMAVHFVTQMLELYFSWGDFTDFANNAWFANTYAAAIIKQVCILAQLDRVRFLFVLHLTCFSQVCPWSVRG
jgi:hypothetical protein